MSIGELDLYDFKNIDWNSDAGSAEVDFFMASIHMEETKMEKLESSMMILH